MANKMLIDATHPEETRVVVLRGNRVEEFDFETAHRKQLRGNIYLAKVTRVEPSLQAAFVEYGGNRHGFLAFSEIHPDYYQIPVADRQALIEADARAARDDDESEERPRGNRRNRGRGRNRERPHARRDETVQSDPLAADGTSHQTTEHHDPENMAAAAQPAEPHQDDAGGHASEQPTPASALPIEAAPLAGHETHGAEAHADEPHESAIAPHETGDKPFEAAPLDHHDDHDDHHAAEGHDAHGHEAHGDEAHRHEAHSDEAHGDEAHGDDDHSHDAEGTEAHGHDDHPHENGHDEEEEVVDTVGGSDAMEEVADRAPRYRRTYKIQEVIKRRQVMLVQVVKEERGTKGAALTTYLSLAGRYCVLMPNTARGGGISRKITSADDRKKLREIAEELEVPEGMGVILRTAGAARTKAEVKRDFEYLLRIWEQVRDLTLKSTAPNLVHEEGSLAKRSIRDLYSKDIDEIVVAGEQGYKEAKDFMRMLMPSHAKNVKLYHDSQPVFTRYGIEGQLDAMFSPTVQLRSGGYIVINQTEALVAIDVNSGRSTREHHIEDTALKTNCEASEEVARQLRLRDLAGLIVIDYIDMDEKRNNRTVERRLKEALRNDRARIQVGRISHFGLMEMSRQRIRTSVLESSTEKCPHCDGTGHVRSVSSVALQLLRAIEEMLLKGPTHNLIVRTRPEVALYVLNHKRAHLRELEQRFHVMLTVNSDGDVAGQTGFVIDRGEQVMTIEQAKAVLVQAAEAAPVLIEEEEPDTGETFEDEAEAEAGEHASSESSDESSDRGHGSVEEVGGDDDDDESQPAHANDVRENGDGPADGRGRRRRRRRGRGGRGGEGREGSGYSQPRRDPMHAENGEAPTGGTQQFGQPGSGEFAPTGMAPEAGASQFSSENGDAQGNGQENGHSNEPGSDEPRRRRRGRRGGRRNRRDGQNGDFAAPHDANAQGFDRQDAQSQHGEAHQPSPSEGRNEWSQPRETQARVEPASPPPFEAAPQPSPAPQSAAEPPRRRSTVREAAPSASSSAPVAMPASQPAPEPVVTAAPDTDATKPKKSGWWAKKLLGG